MKLFDITIPICPTLAVWPGDTPFALTWNQRIEHGDSVNVCSVTMSTHTGSHVDAPNHFLTDGSGVDTCDLARYWGPAVVVDVTGAIEITVADLQGIDLRHTPRVLFKTLAWVDHETFPIEVPVMADDVPSYLHDQGVVLIGVDVPSVDKLASKDLPNHHRLTAHGIAILEALDLSRVSTGVYELIALPLKLVGADGSPVRAVLRSP
jgi:arylformamidase